MFSQGSDQKAAGFAEQIASFGNRLHQIPSWAWIALGVLLVVWIVRSGTKRSRY